LGELEAGVVAAAVPGVGHVHQAAVHRDAVGPDAAGGDDATGDEAEGAVPQDPQHEIWLLPASTAITKWPSGVI